MGTAQTRRTAFIYHRNENANQGKNRKDRIKNETIRGIAKVTPIRSVRTKNRLSWYGHVVRREETHITRSTLSMKVTGTRPRGRPKMRWLDRLCEKRRHHMDGRRRKRLITVSIWAVMIYFSTDFTVKCAEQQTQTDRANIQSTAAGRVIQDQLSDPVQVNIY